MGGQGQWSVLLMKIKLTHFRPQNIIKQTDNNFVLQPELAMIVKILFSPEETLHWPWPLILISHPIMHGLFSSW